MKTHTYILTLMATLTLTTLCYAGVGMQNFDIQHQARETTARIWYPTQDDQSPTLEFKHKVWQGEPVIQNAAPTPGRYPLVLLSHGMGGAIENQSWLAHQLVAAGYIVASLNHPGTSFRNQDSTEMPKLQARAEDLTRLIDAVLTMTPIASSIDAERIAAVGHSLGGYTVMRTVGAQHSNQRFIYACGQHQSNDICGPLERLGLNAQTLSPSLEAEVRDHRIKAVVSLDLGGSFLFTPESLQSLSTPILIIGASLGGHIDQETESRYLSGVLPAKTTRYIEGVSYTHFDFMGECTEKGLEILQKYEPEDAMVCDGGTSERRQKHHEIGRSIVDFLKATL
ncbi:MAG: alpha/beta hydrolase [Gammaproteobacteria bacterium]|nr:alpha/beta hydrolase [Gammaproteobacteria bacterium]